MLRITKRTGLTRKQIITFRIVAVAGGLIATGVFMFINIIRNLRG